MLLKFEMPQNVKSLTKFAIKSAGMSVAVQYAAINLDKIFGFYRKI